MKKKILIGIVIAVVLVIGAFALCPQTAVKGGLSGGPIGTNESAYKEVYKCFGWQRDFCPAWPDYGCDRLCYGIIYGRQCSIETNTDQGIQSQATSCR